MYLPFRQLLYSEILLPIHASQHLPVSADTTGIGFYAFAIQLSYNQQNNNLPVCWQCQWVIWLHIQANMNNEIHVSKNVIIQLTVHVSFSDERFALLSLVEPS